MMSSLIDKLTLLSGGGVPFPSLQLVIEQPKLKDIAVLGEKDFYSSLYMLTADMSKDLNFGEMDEQQAAFWKNKSSLDILLIALGADPVLEVKTIMFFSLIIPSRNIKFSNGKFEIIDRKDPTKIVVMEDHQFEAFQVYLKTMFKIDGDNADVPAEFNPGNTRAQEIADKINKYREKVAEQKGSDSGTSLSAYISGLAVGTNVDLNTVFEYTVYQFREMLDRYGLFKSHDVEMSARMQGAKDIESTNVYQEL